MSLVFRFLLKMPMTQPLSYLSKSPVGVVGSSKDHFLLCAQPVPKSRIPGWTTAAEDQHNPGPAHTHCASSSGMPRHQHLGAGSCQTLQLNSALPNKQKLKNKRVKKSQIIINSTADVQSAQELGSVEIMPFSGRSPSTTQKDALGAGSSVGVPVLSERQGLQPLAHSPAKVHSP